MGNLITCNYGDIPAGCFFIPLHYPTHKNEPITLQSDKKISEFYKQLQASFLTGKNIQNVIISWLFAGGEPETYKTNLWPATERSAIAYTHCKNKLILSIV